MSNISTLSANDTFTRLNKDGTVKTTKAGLTVQRTAIGVAISGNKAERNELANRMFRDCWINGQFKPIATELNRVFGKTVTGFADKIGLSMVTGKLEDSTFGLTNRGAWEAIFRGLQKENDAKAFKGEKASFLQAIVNAQATFAAMQAEAEREKQVKQAQIDAGLALPDSTTIEGETRTVEADQTDILTA